MLVRLVQESSKRGLAKSTHDALLAWSRCRYPRSVIANLDKVGELKRMASFPPFCGSWATGYMPTITACGTVTRAGQGLCAGVRSKPRRPVQAPSGKDDDLLPDLYPR